MRYIRSLTSLSLLFAWLLADRINRYGTGRTAAAECFPGFSVGICRSYGFRILLDCFLTAAIPDDIPGANPCGDRNFRRYESAICDFPGIRPGYDRAANSSAASFLIVFYRLVPAIFRRLSRKNYFIVFSGV